MPRNGEQNFNLCGDLSFASIYETVTGEQNTTQAFWEMRGGGKGTTDTKDWLNVAKQIGWEAEVVFLDWRDPYSQVSEYLANGAYLMVCGLLDSQTGRMSSDGIGHWVVVAESSQYGITLYNPFTNTYQYYTWDEFTDTDGATLVIWKPQQHDENPIPAPHTNAQ